ncbi:hypothetical protein S7711_11276 [Stachybotrys chartarum IBT 7711]|uniref:Uncharacterized protein n=1 Tax=Stachybotrys chartarum (strain CBS 109288 / IBT 7711) TaxID=1280523 RepID=A0A084AZU0_STACB|nr:hypothetical protein S7711_11276 [Stachybotrys chartarum IBT 7711]
MPSTQVAAADGLHHEPFAHYCPNVVTRVMPFVAPICLLLTLFETPLSPRIRMSTVFHALADPIDFSWSLIHKVAAWTECYNLTSGFVERERLADGHIPKARVVATIIVGLDEIAGPRQSSHQSFLEAAKHYIAIEAKSFVLWRLVALELADHWKHGISASLLFTVFYILQLLGAAMSEFEVCCTPFAAVLLSWVVPLALLSGRIGGLGSPRACLDAISRFVEGITAEDAMVKYRTADSGMKRLRHDIQGVTSRKYAEYHPSVDGYRPWKARSVNGSQQSTIPSTAFIAALPLIISTATFVSLLWIAGPDSTTHQWFLAPVLLGIWVLSTLLSQGICYRVSYKHQWHVTIAKDVAVATLIVLAIILLSTASSINEANGSGIGSGPGADTEFGITINLLYEHGGVYRADYVSVLALCFGSQLCFYAAVVRKYRAGLMVMQWPEETRRLEYAQLETRTAAWAS